MFGESLAIIAVIAVMAVMLARRGKRGFALVTLPLVGVPLFHLLGTIFRQYRYLVMIDIAGLAVGFCLCVVLSRGFTTRRGRVGYLVFSGVFMAALLLAYLLHLL